MYQKELISQLANEIKDCGFRVFVAESGTYGFYTDDSGARVVSFYSDLGVIHFSGNYEPCQDGTGWRIETPETTRDLENALRLYPPSFVRSGFRFSTLDSYLKRYQNSSKFVEM